MAIMRRYVDKRTIGSLAADGTASYAHGLPATPDIVTFRLVNQVTATDLFLNLRAAVNATNITVNNGGGGASGDFEVSAVAFHSLVQ